MAQALLALGIRRQDPKRTNGWLAFIDPFHLDAESWIRSWNKSFAPLPVFGGLASGVFSEQTTQVYLNGEVFEDGGVAVSVGGDVKLSGVISQGCTPIGETWTLTRVEQNLIHQIANRPAYAVLAETVQAAFARRPAEARGNLFIGLVVNEYLEDFHRGDFLVRNLIGMRPEFRRAARSLAPCRARGRPSSFTGATRLPRTRTWANCSNARR